MKKLASRLIFLTNELQTPSLQKSLRLPLEFIAFGIAEGRMYKHFRNQSNFVIPVDSLKRWGNDVVYGGLFICKDFDFYANILDAYHVCSLSTMMRNHKRDIHHRVEVEVTTIHFQTLDELARLQYRESESIKAQMYMGNINHPKINLRLTKTVSYRIVSGIDTVNFKQLFGEVKE